MEMNILHISDMHVGMDILEGENSIGGKIDAALSSLDERYYPNVLIVTGDFTNAGSNIEFNNARDILCEFKNYDTLKNIESCILVPGNHDYEWEQNGKKLDDSQKIVGYKNFLDTFRTKVNRVKKANLQKSLDKYMIQHCLKKIGDGDKAVLIIGMNSMLIDSKERAGQGFFSTEQFNVIKKLINYYKENDLVILVAFHHHIIPVAAVERETLADAEKFTLTLDARRAINFFLENNIRFALHGHQHQPSVVTWKDNANFADKELTIISGGSVSARREVMGDISKNSFMLYSIDESQFVVRHFCSSDADTDIFEEDSKRQCHFELWKSKGKEIKCDVQINSNAPRGLEMHEYNTERDTSNLYYLYLNVVDCHRGCIAIDRFTKAYNEATENKVTICGLHHLYGKYDILVKYRHDEATDIYKKKLEKYLKDCNEMLRSESGYFINVSYERLYYEDQTSIPILKNTEDYLNSTWNMAMLEVETGKRLPPGTFLEKLQEKIEIFNQKNNTKIEDIVRNYVIGQDQNVLFELFISCYQFPMLTRFTNIIEEIIKDYGVDKSTHIIYYYDEREV